jgi:alanine-glyoxylate transaminase/serine-glyoxylate transaminase/serine-pyruvate transaminase
MDVMVLFGIATAEMAFVDLIFPASLGSGVSAAQEYYLKSTKKGEHNVHSNI